MINTGFYKGLFLAMEQSGQEFRTEQELLEEAWQDLQAVPSYVELQAALFARSTTYEVYQASLYSCSKDWLLLGKLEVSSVAELHIQINAKWPSVADILAIDTRTYSITSMDDVKRSVANPVAF